jgi:catechol 2,3-dioxygenase
MSRSDMGGVNIAFLASGARDHHELGLVEVGPDAPAAAPGTIGLVHFAFRMNNHQELEAAYRELKAAGVPISFTVNHGVTDSVYFTDPDGNELEMYADNPADRFEQLPNAYAGIDKLEFAPEDKSIVDALAALK